MTEGEKPKLYLDLYARKYSCGYGCRYRVLKRPDNSYYCTKYVTNLEVEAPSFFPIPTAACQKEAKRTAGIIDAEFGTTAKEFVQENLDKGCICPICLSHVKKYKRKFNVGMACSLIWLYRSYQKKNAPVSYQETAPRYIVRNRQMGKLKHWGLARQVENDDPNRKDSGFWYPTSIGIDFVLGKTTIHEYAYILHNNLTGYDGKQITIIDALKNKFSYAELMQGK